MKQATGSYKAKVRLRKKPKRSNRTLGKFKATAMFPGTIVTTAGAQGVQLLAQAGTGPQFVLSVTTPTIGQTAMAYFDSNPSLRLSGSNVFPAGTIPDNDRIFVEGYDFRFKMTNMESIGSTVIIYVLKHKTASNQDPQTVWGRVMASQQLAAPNGPVQVAGGTNKASVGFRNSDPGILFESPLSQRDFRAQFQCVKTHRFNFASAASEDITISVDVNKTVSREMVTDLMNSNNGTSIPGVTVTLMAVVHSQVVIDKTGGTAHVATTGSAEIGWICSQKVRMSMLRSQSSRVDTNRVWDNVPGGATLADQHTINENDVDQTTQQS